MSAGSIGAEAKLLALRVLLFNTFHPSPPFQCSPLALTAGP